MKIVINKVVFIVDDDALITFTEADGIKSLQCSVKAFFNLAWEANKMFPLQVVEAAAKEML